MKNNKEKFLWGVVNIGQQTEGDDINNNWARWGMRGLVPRIGNANNYWNKYQDDHDIVQEIGCNSMRITIEWSRIEPSEGKFDKEAVQHYKNIIKDLQKRNISSVVGLWHWSVPMWFEEKYGMHNNKCVKLFLRFVEHVRDELGSIIEHVVILNEPSVYIGASYMRGVRPPFYKNHYRSFRTSQNLLKMHKCSYRLWKEKFPQTQIGSTYLLNYEAGRDDSFIQNTFLKIKHFLQNGYMMRALKNSSDYIGVNYYTSDSFFFGKSGGRCGVHGTNDWHSSDVWKKFPEGLYYVLMQMKKYKKPIIVLENGKPTNSGIEDVNRQEFLQESVLYMQKAIKCGADVRGYFHYSLCDSYEWNSGYAFKFGLIEIDRKTGMRVKRDSCNVYNKIIKIMR